MNTFLTDSNISESEKSDVPKLSIETDTGQITNVDFSEIQDSITEQIQLSDLNQDGTVNIVDIVQLIEYIFLFEIYESFYFLSEDDFFRSDINADYQLNIMDIVFIVGYIIKI